MTCYRDAALDGPVVALEADGTPPVELCARPWINGDFGDDSEPPPLVACVGPEGVAAVFPGVSPTICDNLKLAALDPERPDEQAREIQLQEALSDRTVSLGCVDAETMTDLAASELERAGLDDDWTVVTQGEPPAAGPCAISRIEPVDRHVVIEFVPDLWTDTHTTTEEE